MPTNLDLARSDPLTVPTLAASQNDWGPDGGANAATWYVSASAAVNVTGIAGGSANIIRHLVNVGSYAITLKAQSASSLATNRFLGPVDTVLAPGATATFRYVAVGSVTGWASGGGTAVSPLSAMQIFATAPSAWYDGKDLLSAVQQTLPNRVNGFATAAQLGSSASADAADPAIVGSSLVLNGTTHYLQLPSTDNSGLSSAAQSFTVLAAFKTTSTTTGVLWSDDSNNALFVNQAAAGKISFRIGATGQQQASTAATYNNGGVVVAGGVVTGGSPATAKLYVYGEGLSSSFNVTTPAASGTPKLGALSSGVFFFAGTWLAHLQWPAALTLSQLNLVAKALTDSSYA